MRQRRSPLNAILELAHVAGETAPHQHFQRTRVKRHGAAVLFVEAFEKLASKLRDVAATVAQRRHQHRHNADAIVKVGAKFVAGHRFFEILVGRRDNAHIDLDGVVAADSLKFLFLQYAQKLGLEGGRDFADLVEKNRALVGEFEAPLARINRAGKCPLFMAEQLGLKDRFRQRCTVDLDERALGARRQLVNGLGDQLLAGAGFTAQQYGRIGFGDDRDLVEQRAQRRAIPNDALDKNLFSLPRWLELGQFLLQTVALGHQTVAVARDDAVELNGLANQIGNHGEETHVAIEPKHRLTVPDPIDGQRSDHLGSNADGHSDERYPRVLRS